MEKYNKIIPFYGGANPEIFKIERRCMDRDGVVIEFLNNFLPKGKILDLGAGNGFTALRLQTNNRIIIPVEPDEKMIDGSKKLLWVRGVAQELPFADSFFDGAYATWAFFFTGFKDSDRGLEELHRVVKDGGPDIIIDNAGNDEFSLYSERDIVSDPIWWKERDFEVNILETSYRFDSVEEGRKLMTFYFGDKGSNINKKEIEYKVAAYKKIITKKNFF